MENSEVSEAKTNVKDRIKFFSTYSKAPPLHRSVSSSSISSNDSVDGKSSRSTSEDEGSGKLANSDNGVAFETKNFLDEEENYCRVLEDLIENFVKFIHTDDFNVMDVLGRIDLIYSYHKNSFLPDLRKSRNALEMINCFIEHKMLFKTYYESFFKNQQNMNLVMCENMNIFKLHGTEKYKKYEEVLLKIPNERMQSYQLFLETLKGIACNQTDNINLDHAITLISNLIKIFVKKEKDIRFIISEIVETERVYVDKLERIVQESMPIIKSVSRKKMKHNSIVGNIPDIYLKQIVFYENLKKCLFDFIPDDLGNCFLRHEDTFKLYLEDQWLKNNPDAIEECTQILKKNNYGDIDLQVSLHRLVKYKLLLQELKKACVRGEATFGQIDSASVMIDRILSEANEIVAVNSIKDENIYLKEQGKLLRRGEFVVQFKVQENKKLKEFTAVVYLFEKAIVFTEKQMQDRTRLPLDICIYKDHLIMKHLGIVEMSASETNFQVYFHGKQKKMFYTLCAKERTTKDEWVEEISKILMRQLLEENERNS